MDVLVVGDANPDLILTGDTVPRFGQSEQLLTGAEMVLGGSAAIVACGLARLGMRTRLAAVVGDDVFGNLVRARLEDRGVDVSAVTVEKDRPTGLSVILDASGDRTILTLPGTIASLTVDQVRSAVKAARPRHLHVASYFLQPGLAAELPGLLDWLRDLGVGTSLDTNWDPGESWSGLADVLSRVDVFMPNETEVLAIARSLGGVASDAVSAARQLAEFGCRVVVKCGAAGALAVGTDGAVLGAPGLAVDVRDATGAGDSFDAGYLAALVGGVTDEAERLSWANAAGALSTRGRGGTAGQATLAELLVAVGASSG